MMNNSGSSLTFCFFLLFLIAVNDAFQSPKPTTIIASRTARTSLNVFGTEERASASTTKEEEEEDNNKKKSLSIEETTKKYGLEAGLFQSLTSSTSKDNKDNNNNNVNSAKSLLKKYGIAYLATSIPLALLSFSICYALVDRGIDVSGILHSTLGIDTDAANNAGTFAIAYAAHKAASPIRFPPTVVLTPIVAKIIGKEPSEEGDDDADDDAAGQA